MLNLKNKNTMKKLFVIAIALFAVSQISCVSTYSLKGDITCFTDNGEILKKYENVVIESGYESSFSGKTVNSNSIKSYGLNFIDSVGKGVIIGKSVPYIIEYRTDKPAQQNTSYNTMPSERAKADLKEYISKLEAAYETNKAELRNPNLTNEQKKELRKEGGRIYHMLTEARNKLYLL